MLGLLEPPAPLVTPGVEHGCRAAGGTSSAGMNAARAALKGGAILLNYSRGPTLVPGSLPTSIPNDQSQSARRDSCVGQ